MKKSFTGNLRCLERHIGTRSIVQSAALAVCLTLAACGSGGKQGEEAETATDQPQEEQQDANASAVAKMEAASGSNVTGEANFTDEGNGRVRFELSVENLSPGEHAVHLHEKGDCSAADASSAGGHWNPTMKPHGKRGSGAHHKGDVGNMNVGNDGKGTLSLVVDGWTIGGADSTNIVGKAVIIHEKADDFTTQPTGNAGGRLSCGVIKEN